jgi:hypothetical protein
MKQVPNFSRYYACRDGRIISRQWKRTNNRRTDGQLSPKTDKDGYQIVRLVRDDGVMIDQKVHRVIALTFLGESPGSCVNHKNGNKGDNRVSNLEYMSIKSNIRHACSTGLRRGFCLSIDPVSGEFDLSPLVLLLNQGFTHREIARQYGVHRGSVGRILREHGIYTRPPSNPKGIHGTSSPSRLSQHPRPQAVTEREHFREHGP